VVEGHVGGLVAALAVVEGELPAPVQRAPMLALELGAWVKGIEHPGLFGSVGRLFEESVKCG
jgi:hypothetical protein